MQTQDNLLEKIHAVDLKVTQVLARLDALLPQLATKTDIAIHEADCGRRRASGPITINRRRKLAWGGGIAGAAATVIYAIVQLLSSHQ